MPSAGIFLLLTFLLVTFSARSSMLQRLAVSNLFIFNLSLLEVRYTSMFLLLFHVNQNNVPVG